MGRRGNLDYVSSSYSYFPLRGYLFPSGWLLGGVGAYVGGVGTYEYYFSHPFSSAVSALRLCLLFWE